MFNVEIQADDKSWFIAFDGENLNADDATKMVENLRAQGFTARAKFADEQTEG